MDRVGFRKNFLIAFSYLLFPIGIVALLDCKADLTKEDKRHIVSTFVAPTLAAACCTIPVAGWVLATVIAVFEIVAIVRAFLNKLYQIPVVWSIASKFVK